MYNLLVFIPRNDDAIKLLIFNYILNRYIKKIIHHNKEIWYQWAFLLHTSFNWKIFDK